MNRDILVDDIRVRGVGKTSNSINFQFKAERKEGKLEPKNGIKKSVYFEAGYLETSIFDIEDIQMNDKIDGPAIIIDKNR